MERARRKAPKAMLFLVLVFMLFSFARLSAQAVETYAMVVFMQSGEFWTYCLQGAKDAAELIGGNKIKLVFQGTKEWSGADEALLLDQMIGTKPKGFLITAADAEALTPSINRAVKGGIPVVCFDTDAPSSMRVNFVGTDNYQSGVMAGRAMGNLVKAGKIGITTVIGPAHLASRLQGVKDVFASEFPQITIVNVVDDKSQTDMAATIAAGMLQANLDMKAIMCMHGQGGVGFVPGIRQAGKKPGKDVFVSAWDFSKETLDGIERGEINFTVAQNPYAMGYWAMMVAYANNHQPTAWSPAVKTRKGKLPPGNIDTGVVIVSPDNVKAWR